MIWPFITLYIREQTSSPMPALNLFGQLPALATFVGSHGHGLSIPVTLTTVTTLLSLQALSSVIGTSLISTLMDRFGRKIIMMVGLAAFAGVLMTMSSAVQLWQWVVLLPLYGILQPVFYIGCNAMVADVVRQGERTSAFALIRTVSNVGIATGPALFGVWIAQSHTFAYFMTAAINLMLLIPVIFLLRETLPSTPAKSEVSTGYKAVFRDRPFVTFIAVFTLIEIAAALVFNLLAVYTKENFQIPEDQFGRLIGINALMVVFFQYGVTRLTRRYNPLLVMAAGCLFYVAGLIVFGLSNVLPHFMLGMAVLTLGELMVSPTSNAHVANLAPADKRARYMGIYSLTYTFGTGVGPIAGGFLSDSFGQPAIWYGGAVVALLASAGFWLMSRGRQAATGIPLVVGPQGVEKPAVS